MSRLALHVAGIGVYAPGLPGWPAAAEVLRGTVPPDPGPLAKPAPPLLPAAERRRAPDSVLYAAQAAAEACAMAELDPAALPAVFSSPQGDIAITDYMCSTLVRAPQELSPTRFHNSVHNAAVGYWSIATGCREPSTALSAWTASVGAGLLEAAIQTIDADAPVLFAAYDAAAAGPLRSVVPFDCGFAVALVLAPASGPLRGIRLELARAAEGQLADAPGQDWERDLLARNACADALVLLRALAAAGPGRVHLAAGPRFVLELQVTP